MKLRDLLRLVTLCAVFAPALAGGVATARAATTVGDARVVIETVSGTLEANIRDLAVQDATGVTRISITQARLGPGLGETWARTVRVDRPAASI